MKVTSKSILNHPRVDTLHKEYGFGGEDKWGWWCVLKPGYIFSNKAGTINERTLADIAYEVKNSKKLK